MGHRRVGVLPKTQRWRDLVEQLETFSGDEGQLAHVVANTLQGVRNRFARIESDTSVRECLEFLVALAVAAGAREPLAHLANAGIELPEGDSPLALASALGARLEDRAESPEYATIAEGAACDALSRWYRKNASETPSLFGEDFEEFAAWRKLSTGAGFCELARLYFAGFTERYLRYFLEREASQAIETLLERDAFDRQLAAHIDAVSHHAFETAKITQSFAAGWFNKHAGTGMPRADQISGFLSLAFGKIREELRREGSEQ